MKLKQLVAVSCTLVVASAGYGQRFDDTRSGLPGWGKTGKDAIVKLTVVRVDLSVSFLDAVYIFTNKEDLVKIGEAFANFERVAEDIPEYDDSGNLVPREHGTGMVKPLYQIIVTREREQRLLYLTVERNVPPTTVVATLWTLRPDGMFIRYSSCTYEGIPEGDEPRPLKVLAAMCPPRAKRAVTPGE
ncbi:MAG: hypothetical protein N2255_03560 [Kiritimatiellae bacterium]|nr:hypothetical protein [Kiritimatiellia bacterium]